jgi:hypothetical protein
MGNLVCHVREDIDEETREDWRQACKELDYYGEHEGRQYCVLHFPGEDKKEDFKKALENKRAQNDFHFGGTVFPENTLQVQERAIHEDVIFSGATFVGGVRFFRVTFNGKIDFSRATFVGGRTSFAESTFNNYTDFQGAQFSGEETSFRSAQFCGNETLFLNAQFSSQWTNLQGANFNGKLTNFSSTTFTSPRNTYFTGAKFSSEVTNFLSAKFYSQETYFARAQFSSKRTYFSDTQFCGERTLFSEAQFNGQTNFQDATLMNATFENTTFDRGANFTRVTFKGTQRPTTDFRRATFGGELYFRGAEFTGFTDFYRTNFLDAVRFIGGERGDDNAEYKKSTLVFAPKGQVSFKRARIDKPELFSFDTVRLRPSWFVGVDARKLDFTSVKWDGLLDGSANTLDREVKGIRETGETGSPYVLLAQACRRLSANAEENREYPRANEFHYWSMDALRIGRWRYLGWLRQFIKKNWRRISARFGLIAGLLWIWRILRREPLRHTMPSRFGLVPTFYWALSGYGVRAARAFWILVAMWAAFTTLYVLVDPSEFNDFGQGIGYRWQAAVYSLLALARLNPEPRPDEPGVFQFLVGLEGILGPLQLALLALAIRRKVMR